MRVLFRVDSSVDIGSGHVMRCLTLAKALRAHAADIRFVCRCHAGNLCSYIEDSGFPVSRLAAPQNPTKLHRCTNANAYEDWVGAEWQTDALETADAAARLSVNWDWVVVDHYGLDCRWQGAARNYARRVLVIDDLATRKHSCDLLLDQNFFHDPAARYSSLVSRSCRTLFGPRYALLRNEFLEASNLIRRRRGRVQRLLIFLGGMDPKGMTQMAIQAVQATAWNGLRVDVVVGGQNPHRDAIQTMCGGLPGFLFHCDVSNMAELMAHADLAIGGGGATTWERIYLQLPAIVVGLANNQEGTASEVARFGAHDYLGACESLDTTQVSTALRRLMNEPEACARMSRRCAALMNDFDGPRGIIEQMIALLDREKACAR